MLKLAACNVDWNYLKTILSPYVSHVSFFYPFSLYFHPSAYLCLHFSTLLLPSPCKHIPNLVYGMNFTPESSLWKGLWVLERIWQSAEDAVACWQKQPNSDWATNETYHSRVVLHCKQDGETLLLGWVVGPNAPVFRSVKLWVCLWWKKRRRRESGDKRNKKQGGEQQTDYDLRPWLSTPAALTPPMPITEIRLHVCVQKCAYVSVSKAECVPGG